MDSKGLVFVLRQKKDLHFQTAGETEYQVVQDLDIRPGMNQFYPAVTCNKGDGLGPFNLAIYWKRPYRGQGPKAPWYILTNLSEVKQVMAIYRCRWGIEQLFKDCKTGGYNLEETQVNDQRFLALVLLIALAYTFATFHGQRLRQLRLNHYAGRLQEHQETTLRQSDFSLGLYGQRWIYAMELWHHGAVQLIALKPHKRLFFQRGLQTLSLMQKAF
ncbi:MAG: IS4 family transposase [Leptolyngbya sp. SIOISBB]|nr:IS4 family transposase [Leptolyngbya sp. SIOISBB]